jgi:hypothetical protein
VLEFAHRFRLLLLEHQPSGIAVDLALGDSPFEKETVRRGVVKKWLGLTVRLPTLEDLIIMKAVAARPRDLVDIALIVEFHPSDLDLQHIQHWLRAFSEVLDGPDRWDLVAPLLRPKRP